MTREEFESRRNEMNSRMEGFREEQHQRDERYKEKLENGNVSGIEKFFHGVSKLIFALNESANKQINKM
jgi:hypothetical protein